MLRVAARISVFVFAGAGAVAGCSCSNGSDDGRSTQIPAAGKIPPAAGTASPTDGATLFAQNCVGCHGQQGAGGGRAPKLAGRKTPEAEATEVITNGKGRMPPFKSRLQPDQIAAVAKYVSAL